MLGNLAVLDAEDVDGRASGIRLADFRVNVQDHKVAFGDHPLDVGLSFGILLEKRHEEVDERLAPFGDVRVVLAVGRAQVFFRGFLRFVGDVIRKSPSFKTPALSILPMYLMNVSSLIFWRRRPRRIL